MIFEYYGKPYEIKNEKDINEFLKDLNDDYYKLGLKDKHYTKDWLLWTLSKVLMIELGIFKYRIFKSIEGTNFLISEKEFVKFTQYMIENNDEELLTIFCNELHITPIDDTRWYYQINLNEKGEYQ